MTLSYIAYNDDGDEVERYTFPRGVSRVLLETIAAPVTHRTRIATVPTGEGTPLPMPPSPLPEHPAAYYRAAVLALTARSDVTGRWLTGSVLVRLAMSTLPKRDRKGSHAPLRLALDTLAADPAEPVQREPAPRGDGRTVRRYRLNSTPR